MTRLLHEPVKEQASLEGIQKISLLSGGLPMNIVPVQEHLF